MASTRLVVPYCSSGCLHINRCCKFQTSFPINPVSHSKISKDGSRFLADRSLQYLSNGQRNRRNSNTKIDLVVYSSSGVEPGAPIPSEPSNFPKGWILGLLITVILPFFSSKWGPLLGLKKGFENAVETAEQVTETIEKVAEEVEKVAEEIAEDLPAGGKLQKALVYAENVAKETAKDAQLGEEIIDKIEDLEKDLGSMIDQANEISKEATAKEATDKEATAKEATDKEATAKEATDKK
ncbi:hypothetical protein F0562_035672 [Nyssa sinensis]|uniref:Uncharacterized protein n=1 Tax=Nyssa sinensis TaxID=561372 RepID=A0A5J5AFU7_9ASTE|nr:hypothetical protein F0562_035672 [Nyssa sinensis]